jgi:hypothetical protein
MIILSKKPKEDLKWPLLGAFLIPPVLPVVVDLEKNHQF